MKTFPHLTTERWLLTELRYTDIPAIIEYAGDAAVSRYTLNMPHPYSEEHAIFWINMANTGWEQEDHFVFAIRDRETEAFLGSVGLKITKRFRLGELAYWLAAPFWGKGIMTEAVAAIIRFGFQELHLNKIAASHVAKNPASGKVMETNGMLHEGVRPQQVARDGVFHDLVNYGILRQDYHLIK